MALLAALLLQVPVLAVDLDPAGRIVLADGRRFELAGAVPLELGPPPTLGMAWAGAWDLELVSQDEARPERAWLTRGEQSLSALLVRHGHARPDPLGLPGPLADELAEAARAGIEARSGYRARWPAAVPGPSAAPIAGVALPLHHLGEWQDYRRHLCEIRALGAGWVHLLVHGFQLDASSSGILWETRRTPREAWVVRTIRLAREEGLQVLLTPVILLLRPGTGDWRGSLRPSSPDRWWLEYGRFLLRMADVAAEGGASALCIGSELASMEGERARWTRLARDVRTRFDGALTYSANWDHFRSIGFWDALDFAGLSAYFELAEADDPTPIELLAGWTRALEDVRVLAAEARLPVVLTEVGLPSLRGAARTPWDYTLKTPIDLEVQAEGFRAFGQVFLGPRPPETREALGGFFLYDWWGEGGPRDDSYTARGKPAEDVWRELLRAARKHPPTR